MNRSTHLYLFGDQSVSFNSGLHQLFHVKTNSLLTSFFEQVHDALRREIGHLPLLKRILFPRFTNILELSDKYHETGDNPALEGALTCIHQLACFINGGFETYPLPSQCHLVGLCTGLLPAAAISCSQSISQLLPVAIEVVLIAFRAGLHTSEVRERIQAQGSLAASPSWASVISGIHEEALSAAIAQFCHQNNVPPSSKPYVTVVGPQSVSVSGPPAILEQFCRSSSIEGCKHINVPIHAPYHASHLYSEADIDEILGRVSKNILFSYSPKIPIFSSVTGGLISAESFGSLLRILLNEMLIETVRWDKVLEGCASVLSSLRISECNAHPIATNTLQSLVSALRQFDRFKVKINHEMQDEGVTGSVKSAAGKTDQSKIAIIGLSGRYPDAASPELFWDLLYKGLDVHREVPPDRFDARLYYDPTGKKKNTSQVLNGCWIEEPGLFDARFFNMSPREAAQADPAQRLALVTAYEALEMAGFVPDSTPSTQRDRVGLFYGMTSDDWREVNSGQNVDTYFIPGGNRAFTPGRINYHFKFSGPSFSVDTACSSSLAAVNLACNSLWNGDCDTALAGGTNILTNPDNFAGLDRAHFLSRTGNCNTFDDGADGYCRADGVGTVVLKRLEDALADNDPIQGVILGAITNHSAEAVSITRPHVGAQEFVFQKLLNSANLDPLDVSYIEMHGTGTQAGDAVEMKSVLDIFSPKDRKRGSHQPLYLGSAKANIGHGESASGVTSLAKVLLMMEKNVIPPHCGIKKKINHNFPTNLRERNVHIAFEPTPWNRPKQGLRKVFVNNFSAAGGNTALLLEDAPVVSTGMDEDPRSCYVVAVSAKSITSLKQNTQALITFINQSRNLSLPSLSYTTTARRLHHNYRIMVNGSNCEQISAALEKSTLREDHAPVSITPPRVAFAFTGQGSQYTGMGSQLYRSFSQFRSDINGFDTIGQNFGFASIRPFIAESIDINSLSPLVVQLGITCLQMALARLWISWGVNPGVVIGHSLGEYAALNTAGVLSASDTIYLTGKRAQLLQDYCSVGTHAMLAIKGPVSRISTHMQDSTAEIACINSPDETVVSGTVSEINVLSEGYCSRNEKCVKLQVPFAFHSSQVQPIMTSFEGLAQGVTFHEPLIPVISPLLAEVVTSVDVFGPAYLTRHCREAVNFLGAIKTAQTANVIDNRTLWVEVGSHPICSGMIRAIDHSAVTHPTLKRNEDLWKVLTGSLSSLYLGGVDIHWPEFHRDFKSAHEVLHLPTYSWDNKNYWIQYVHDWCLTKGNPPELTVANESRQPVVPTLSTTTVQKVVEEYCKDNKPTVTMESDISQPNLNALFQGHKVNGAALCSSSIYADIALTLGEYLLKRFQPNETKNALDVCNMVIEKPLIAKGQGTQLFRATITADWNTSSAIVTYYSVTPDGRKTVDHAKCTVEYGDGNTWLEKWKREEYLIKHRIQMLHAAVSEGQIDRIKRGMAYKLFSSLVHYDQMYRGMEEVALDSSELEATARVALKVTENDGKFHTSPCWIDSLGHLSGFIMNANDSVDSSSQVYINHGWDSMRCCTKLSNEKTYQTYVKMQQVNKTMFSGDVYILEDGAIVGVNRGVQFQGVTRQLLNQFLPSKVNSSTAPNKASTPTAAGGKRIPILAPKPIVIPSRDKPTRLGVMAQALALVAEEIGISSSELSDDTQFADLGLDSLLSLTISGKLREELSLEVESSLFHDYPTVKDFKNFLSQSHSGEEEPQDYAEYSSTEASTPATRLGMSSPAPESVSSVSEDDDSVILKSIHSILAQEIGLSIEEIGADSNLPELGLDSLMSLTVLGRLREECGIDPPSDLFPQCTTVTELAVALGINTGRVLGEAMKPPPELKETNTLQSTPPATSILLQGHPKTSRKTLFLFPDGSGSSTSYGTLPKIGSDVAVYGLNCPYMKMPEDLTCSLDGLTAPYLAEVRRRQPSGPYYLGGWSAGGICAYDAAQQLLREGEDVARLILIDSPFPIGLEKLPPRLYAFFESIGLFGQGSQAPPEWLLRHFLAFIDALDRYVAVPFPPGKAPKTHLVWARDGVCKNPSDPRPTPQADDPREMRWLLENRTDFGPNGWDRLLGGKDKLVIEDMEGANHFTMMEGEKGKILRDFIGRAMA